MEKVVEEILLVEKEAEAIIGEARKKAMEIQARADAEVQEALTNAKLEALTIVKNRAKEASETAALFREKALKEAEENKRLIMNRNADKIDKVVDSIVDIVTRPLYTS